MEKASVEDMDLFFINKEEKCINWLFIDHDVEGEKIFCNYKYTFDEFTNLANTYHVSDWFFEKLMEAGEHTIIKEREPKYIESVNLFYDGSYNFEGLKRETIEGILSFIREQEKNTNIDTFRVLTPEEQKYTFHQSTLEMVTGCIAHIRADFGSMGNSFITIFDDHNSVIAKYVSEFKEEVYNIIDILRYDESYNGLLYNRKTMEEYCAKNKDAAFTVGNVKYYGFRADTEHYSYLLRCNPKVGRNNLYCYIYEKEKLNKHIKNASKGISFIDKNLQERLHVDDGGIIRINFFDGGYRDLVCRYYDDSHFVINNTVNSTHEFMHSCEVKGHTIEIAKRSLADMIKCAVKSKEHRDEPEEEATKSI